MGGWGGSWFGEGSFSPYTGWSTGGDTPLDMNFGGGGGPAWITDPSIGSINMGSWLFDILNGGGGSSFPPYDPNTLPGDLAGILGDIATGENGKGGILDIINAILNPKSGGTGTANDVGSLIKNLLGTFGSVAPLFQTSDYGQKKQDATAMEEKALASAKSIYDSVKAGTTHPDDAIKALTDLANRNSASSLGAGGTAFQAGMQGINDKIQEYISDLKTQRNTMLSDTSATVSGPMSFQRDKMLTMGRNAFTGAQAAPAGSQMALLQKGSPNPLDSFKQVQAAVPGKPGVDYTQMGELLKKQLNRQQVNPWNK